MLKTKNGENKQDLHDYPLILYLNDKKFHNKTGSAFSRYPQNVARLQLLRSSGNTHTDAYTNQLLRLRSG